MTRQDASETLRRLEVAVADARTFFGIDPLWETPITANADDGAVIHCHVGYYRAPIQVELDFFQQRPETIREYMAHEVAHILSAEVNRLRSVLPPEYADKNAPQGRIFDDALEVLTVRLERLFMRHCPETP